MMQYSALVAAFKKEGKADILWDFDDGTEQRSAGNRVLWLSKADGRFSVLTVPAVAAGALIQYRPLIADFNGDGKADILWDFDDGTYQRSAGTRVMWTRTPNSLDLLV